MSADDPDEGEEYLPTCAEIMDGGCVIFDPIEFAEKTNSIAAMVMDGGLFVLDADTQKWRNVELIKKAPGLSRVQ